jgi:hypothetical protein
VRETAGHNMMLEHGHLQSGVCQQGGCRKAAQSRADDRDVIYLIA